MSTSRSWESAAVGGECYCEGEKRNPGLWLERREGYARIVTEKVTLSILHFMNRLIDGEEWTGMCVGVGRGGFPIKMSAGRPATL